MFRQVDGTATTTLTLNLPKERRRGSTALDVQLTPSLAAIALDALPYLADYPYGCIEQTMSRFLPSVLVARSLRDSEVDLETLRQPRRPRTSSSPPQRGAEPDSGYTYPREGPAARRLELASRCSASEPGPDLRPGRLDAMVRDGPRPHLRPAERRWRLGVVAGGSSAIRT